jgi:hypothetical protein
MIDGLIIQQVRGDPGIQGMLAAYDGHPAFFYQKAPLDVDAVWADGCFPRADYSYDMRSDPERQYSASMLVDIWCSNEGEIVPADVEPEIIRLLSGNIYTGRDGVPMLVQWRRTDSFETAKETKFYQKDKNVPTIAGTTLQFDVVAFPSQLTFNPDPIEGFNYWTKRFFPEACVLPVDAKPGVTRPGEKSPLVYWQWISSAATDKNTYAVTWYQCQIMGHVIMNDHVERNRWVKAIAEELSLQGEVVLADASPLFIERITMRGDADRVWDGQIGITGRFGVLNTPRKAPIAQALNRTFLEVTYGG